LVEFLETNNFQSMSAPNARKNVRGASDALESMAYRDGSMSKGQDEDSQFDMAADGIRASGSADVAQPKETKELKDEDPLESVFRFTQVGDEPDGEFIRQMLQILELA
jgi:hypothetical protein